MAKPKVWDPFSTPLGLTAFVAAAGPVGVFFLLWMTGTPGYRYGWLAAPLVGAGALGAAGWFAWAGAGGRRAGRVGAAVSLGLLGLAEGHWMAIDPIPSAGVLRAEMKAVFPMDYEVVDEGVNGNAICFDECTSYSKTWIVPGDIEDAAVEFGEALRAAGYVLGPWEPYEGQFEGVRGEGTRGHLGGGVTVVDIPWISVDGERVPMPPGHVEVTTWFGTD